MTDYFTYSIYQDGMKIASAGSRNQDDALTEAMHYAHIYALDGPVEVKDGRRFVAKVEAVPKQ